MQDRHQSLLNLVHLFLTHEATHLLTIAFILVICLSGLLPSHAQCAYTVDIRSATETSTSGDP